jgi:hypothetical protein
MEPSGPQRRFSMLRTRLIQLVLHRDAASCQASRERSERRGSNSDRLLDQQAQLAIERPRPRCHDALRRALHERPHPTPRAMSLSCAGPADAPRAKERPRRQ